MNILETKNLSIQFGGLKAVQNLNLYVKKGSITALIGPNGAGKTTVFNMLTGVYTPTSGEVLFQNERIEGKKPYEVVKKGISRTFQNIRLFNNLDVLDNVKIAADINQTYGLPSAFLKSPRFDREEALIFERSMELLKLFNLDSRAHELATNLPYGDQRRLEIARALATGAKLICLDEPAAGMNNKETAELMDTIRLIRDKFDLSVLLIEHDMKLVMGISEYIFVLDHGQKICEGPPKQVQCDEKVIEAYLGSKRKKKMPAEGKES